MTKKHEYSSLFLKYDFTYEGIRHKRCVNLEEDAHGVMCLYDEHNLEVTWVKTLRCSGKRLEISIVIADDWNDEENLGKVVASGYVSVYQKDKTIQMEKLVDSFEPDKWEYIDEADSSNSVRKETFYIKKADGEQ